MAVGNVLSKVTEDPSVTLVELTEFPARSSTSRVKEIAPSEVEFEVANVEANAVLTKNILEDEIYKALTELAVMQFQPQTKKPR